MWGMDTLHPHIVGRMADDFSILSKNRYLTSEETLGLALDELFARHNITVDRVPLIHAVVHPNGQVSKSESILGISYGGSVALRSDLGENNPFHLSTAIHEFAHEFLHCPVDPSDPDGLNRAGSFMSLYRPTREREAESVARWVMRRVGLDWPDISAYDTWDDITYLSEAELLVVRMIVNKFHEVTARRTVVPDYYTLVKPAAPRYESFIKPGWSNCLWCDYTFPHTDCRNVKSCK
jgi:hypothetical protein